MSAEFVAQNLISGVLVGALYGMAALGLSLVFGVLKILNVAHGELLMLGGYGSFWVFQLLGIDPYISLLIVLPLLFIGGAILHLGLFSHIVRFDEEHRIKNSLLIGFGLTLILQTAAIRLFEADERKITTAYSTDAFELLGLRLPFVRFSGLIMGVLVVIALGISAWLWWWARTGLTRPIALISAGSVIGGALANALDRVRVGAVVDFLNMSCCGIVNPYAFNLADVGIIAGAVGLLIFADAPKNEA